MARYRAEKLEHAKRMIRQGTLTNARIREALMTVFGSAISPTELRNLKLEIYAEQRRMPGAPIVLNPDGTWEYLDAAGKGPAT